MPRVEQVKPIAPFVPIVKPLITAAPFEPRHFDADAARSRAAEGVGY